MGASGAGVLGDAGVAGATDALGVPVEVVPDVGIAPADAPAGDAALGDAGAAEARGAEAALGDVAVGFVGDAALMGAALAGADSPRGAGSVMGAPWNNEADVALPEGGVTSSMRLRKRLRHRLQLATRERIGCAPTGNVGCGGARGRVRGLRCRT